MKRSKIVLLLAGIMLCSTSVALGFIFGPTNLDMFGYPEFAKKHYAPSTPYSRDTYSMENYRHEVERYREDARKYIEAADNDIRRIEEAKAQAIRDANNAVEQYNRFIRGW